MPLIPEMRKCCLCYSLKTGSFTIAFMLLVGSAVQTGYYAYLIMHGKPPQMCTSKDYRYKEEIVDELLPTDNLVGYWPPRRGYGFLDFFPRFRRHISLEGEELVEAKEQNETANIGSTATAAPDTVISDITAYTKPETATAAAETTTTKKRESLQPNRNTGHNRKPKKYIVQRKIPYTYKHVCPKKRIFNPFDIDVTYLNFDIREPYKKDFLYFNLCVFGTMMCFTPLLMAAVYKESRVLLLIWLVVETILLSAGTTGTIVAATTLFKVLQVSVGIVTLVNMAFHLDQTMHPAVVMEAPAKTQQALAPDQAKTSNQGRKKFIGILKKLFKSTQKKRTAFIFFLTSVYYLLLAVLHGLWFLLDTEMDAVKCHFSKETNITEGHSDLVEVFTSKNMLANIFSLSSNASMPLYGLAIATIVAINSATLSGLAVSNVYLRQGATIWINSFCCFSIMYFALEIYAFFAVSDDDINTNPTIVTFKLLFQITMFCVCLLEWQNLVIQDELSESGLSLTAKQNSKKIKKVNIIFLNPFKSANKGKTDVGKMEEGVLGQVQGKEPLDLKGKY